MGYINQGAYEKNMDQINSVEDIDKLDDSSTSINLGNLLDCVDFSQRQALLNNAIRKICIDGTITIEGIDMFGLCNQFIFGSLTNEQLNNILKSVVSLDTFKSILVCMLNNGLTITEKKIGLGISKSEYKVVATRKA